MATEEIGLNAALGRAGIWAVETDLAALIVELAGVREGDGPREFHLVLLDNGRTDVLSDEVAARRCTASAARRA